MNRLALLPLLLLACTFSTLPLTTAPPANVWVTLPTQPPETVYQTITVTAPVHLRYTDTGAKSGQFAGAGNELAALCAGQWCYLEGGELMVWRGCVDDNPHALGCAKE